MLMGSQAVVVCSLPLSMCYIYAYKNNL
uniref:Uncharacterized protein n=1 Tax=Anguilla anguilla TaxID=7936 RepID=A0A0E9S092_ANGAN